MLKVVKSPDPVLNQMCEPCDPKDKTLKKLSKQMAKAMYANDGVGLAAPQVGVLKRLIVVDCDPSEEENYLVLVNPEILELQGDPVADEEGCLSCPGVNVVVERQPWARVRFLDLDGEMWEIEGDGLLGRCLQHEIDHLNGITIFERAEPKERIRALKAYAEAQKAGADAEAEPKKAQVR